MSTSKHDLQSVAALVVGMLLVLVANFQRGTGTRSSGPGATTAGGPCRLSPRPA